MHIQISDAREKYLSVATEPAVGKGGRRFNRAFLLCDNARFPKYDKNRRDIRGKKKSCLNLHL